MSLAAPAAPSRLHPRTLAVVAVAASAYLGRLGAAAVVLVTVPMAREALDADRFGVWMMLGGLMAFLSFADLGLGNGLMNRLTAAHAAGRRDLVAAELRAGYACAVGIAALPPLAWALWCALAPAPVSVVGDVSAAHRDEVLDALHVFVALVALGVPAALAQKAQLGLQQGHWVGATAFAGALAQLVALPLALHAGCGLPVLVLASFGTQVAVNAAASLAWLVADGRLGELRVARPGREVAAALLRAGLLFLALQLAAAFAFQSDAIVVSQRLGPAAYGDYSVAQRVFLIVSGVLATATAGLWPAFGDALARGDTAWARRTLLRGLAVAGVAAVAAVGAVALAAGPIVRAWVGADAVPAAPLVAVLAAWTVVEVLASVTAAFLNGADAIRAQLGLALAMAGTAFAAKWWAVDAFGTAGAPLATLCAYLLISVPGQVVLVRRILSASEPST